MLYDIHFPLVIYLFTSLLQKKIVLIIYTCTGIQFSPYLCCENFPRLLVFLEIFIRNQDQLSTNNSNMQCDESKHMVRSLIDRKILYHISTPTFNLTPNLFFFQIQIRYFGKANRNFIKTCVSLIHSWSVSQVINQLQRKL